MIVKKDNLAEHIIILFCKSAGSEKIHLMIFYEKDFSSSND